MAHTDTKTTTSSNGNSRQQRTFVDKPATRERVPLLVGLMGPSGGGKTFSALRLATGIQRVNGGEIFCIDTEAKRALHYADRFNFRHVSFSPPFGPLDYLAAIQHCVSKGARTIIIDSMSHEHEGPGGVLEMHEAEIDRLMAQWRNASRDTVQMAAWGKPKAERRRMINTMLQFECNFILCFRAKDKVKVATKEERAAGKEAISGMGFMPIAGPELVFEMTVNCLLLPGAGGVPTWQSKETGEKMMIKLPEQFRSLLLDAKTPLDENMGESMAKWAAGETKDPASEVRGAIREARSIDQLKLDVFPKLEQLKEKRQVSPAEYKALREMFKARGEEIQAAASEPAAYDDEPAESDERQPGEEG